MHHPVLPGCELADRRRQGKELRILHSGEDCCGGDVGGGHPLAHQPFLAGHLRRELGDRFGEVGATALHKLCPNLLPVHLEVDHLHHRSSEVDPGKELPVLDLPLLGVAVAKQSGSIGKVRVQITQDRRV